VANSTTLTLPAEAFAVLVITRATTGASTVTPGGNSPRTGAGTVGCNGGKPGNDVNVGRGVLVAVGTTADGDRPTSVSPTEQARLTPTSASTLNRKAHGRCLGLPINLLTSCR
jgi:hypothetical protein